MNVQIARLQRRTVDSANIKSITHASSIHQHLSTYDDVRFATERIPGSCLRPIRRLRRPRLPCRMILINSAATQKARPFLQNDSGASQKAALFAKGLHSLRNPASSVVSAFTFTESTRIDDRSRDHHSTINQHHRVRRTLHVTPRTGETESFVPHVFLYCTNPPFRDEVDHQVARYLRVEPRRRDLGSFVFS